MLATMILAIAIVAIFSLYFYYWRAVLTGVASLPVFKPGAGSGLHAAAKGNCEAQTSQLAGL